MSDYVIGIANILVGLFCQALITGKLSRTESGSEYWSNWCGQHPSFSKYGPPFLVAFGVLRIAMGLLGGA